MLDISTQPVTEAHEGVNDAVAISPGASALFSFEVKDVRNIGLGLRAEPDRVSAADGCARRDARRRRRANDDAFARPLFYRGADAADAPATTIRVAIVELSPPVNRRGGDRRGAARQGRHEESKAQ
jgi:hypothetical protein